MPSYYRFQQEDADATRRINNRQLAVSIVVGFALISLALGAFDLVVLALAPAGAM